MGYFWWENTANFMTGDGPTYLAGVWYMAVPPALPQSPTLVPAGWE